VSGSPCHSGFAATFGHAQSCSRWTVRLSSRSAALAGPYVSATTSLWARRLQLSAKSGHTPARHTWRTKKMRQATHTTTQHSGRSLGESPPPQGVSPGDPYQQICEEIHRLLTRKRSYYGCPGEKPLANALAVIEDGIDPATYQMARVNEKLRRLRGLRGTLDKGKIRDTICDIAGHAIVAIACLDSGEKT